MPRIVKQTLSDQIFDYLQKEIVEGRWKSGEKLPSETELAASLGVSRVSLRTAIQKCSSLGLTETRVGEGTYVKEFNIRSYFSDVYKLKGNEWDLTTVVGLRSALQIGAFALAVRREIPVEELQKLKSIYFDMQSAANENDLDKYYTANTAFHREMCALAGNDAMDVIYDAVATMVDEATRKALMSSIRNSGSLERSLKYHYDILTAIENKDIEAFLKINHTGVSNLMHYSESDN